MSLVRLLGQANGQFKAKTMISLPWTSTVRPFIWSGQKASDGVIIKTAAVHLQSATGMGGGRVAYEEADAVNSVIYIKKGKLVVLSGTIEGTSTKAEPTQSLWLRTAAWRYMAAESTM